MASEKPKERAAATTGVQTGAYLPHEIRHSATRLSRLGDPATNARLVGHAVQRLLGFWFVYNAMGGIEPMIASGLWPKSTAYKQLAEFRKFYKCNPDELEPELAAAISLASSDWPTKYSHGLESVLSAQLTEKEKSGD